MVSMMSPMSSSITNMDQVVEYYSKKQLEKLNEVVKAQEGTQRLLFELGNTMLQH
jgi:hypothetical protein